MNEDLVCSIARALRPDDEVVLGRRTRPVTVLGFEEQRNQGLIKSTDYPYYIQWLRGNGTEYRLRWSHRGTHYPILHTESELETRETYSPRHGKPRKKTISKPGSRGERVRSISVVGVDDSDLSEWAFSRMVDGIDEEPTENVVS